MVSAGCEESRAYTDGSRPGAATGRRRGHPGHIWSAFRAAFRVCSPPHLPGTEAGTGRAVKVARRSSGLRCGYTRVHGCDAQGRGARAGQGTGRQDKGQADPPGKVDISRMLLSLCWLTWLSVRLYMCRKCFVGLCIQTFKENPSPQQKCAKWESLYRKFLAHLTVPATIRPPSNETVFSFVRQTN